MTQSPFSYSDERFADVQLLRYRLNGFSRLTLQQKQLVYFLSQATLYGRDITFDQNGAYNLLVRRTLEAIVTDASLDHTSADFLALELYLKRVWFANGIHHHYGSDKFVPDFSPDWLLHVLQQVDARRLPLSAGQTVRQLYDVLRSVLFDPTVLPKRVNKADGADLVATSACNFYGEGVTQAEAEAFYAAQADPSDPHPPSYGLNSTLVRGADGRLREEPWITRGRYGRALRPIVAWLQRAADVAESESQYQALRLLVEYYTTGDLRTFDRFSVQWLSCLDTKVDFINGFIEVYGDPLGLKATWEGLVEYVDDEATARTQLISREAQWFEDHSPVDPRFRKPHVRGVSARAICAAMLGGEEYPATAIGINLPNADWIRAEHGSKSVRLSNITDAYSRAARGSGFREEFVGDATMLALIDAYDDLCDDLHTDLHECLGHGSGQLLPGVSADALRSYGNVIEEARADLFGLYYMADAKLVELGLLPAAQPAVGGGAPAWHAHYYTYMMNGLLTQLVRLEEGAQLEEAHMRNRALIARWCLEHGDAMALVQRDGKTYLHIADYDQLRQLVARLLAEVQRIKSEGDHEAARQLVERYAVRVDATLHREVRQRYARLDLAPYKGFINPWLLPVRDAQGRITDIQVNYSESYTHQMLRYSSEYATLI